MQPLLNDAIRDVDAAFTAGGIAASNRQIAEEVRLRHPDVCQAKAHELLMDALVRRVSALRKRRLHDDGNDARQFVLPEFARHMLPYLPNKIPQYPDDDAEVDPDDLPWQTIWRCSVAELVRYDRMLAGQIRNDQKRHRRVRQLTDAAVAGCGGDTSLSVAEAIKDTVA